MEHQNHTQKERRRRGMVGREERKRNEKEEERKKRKEKWGEKPNTCGRGYRRKLDHVELVEEFLKTFDNMEIKDTSFESTENGACARGSILPFRISLPHFWEGRKGPPTSTSSKQSGTSPEDCRGVIED